MRNSRHMPGNGYRSAILALSAALGLAACQPPTRGAGTDPDGLPCSASTAQAGPVFIEVTYAADGMPSARPDTCRIRGDNRVVFRTLPGETRAFTIVFAGALPGSQVVPRAPASPRGSQRVVALVADGQPGQYKYDIHANGHRLDPVIIIDR